MYPRSHLATKCEEEVPLQSQMTQLWRAHFLSSRKTTSIARHRFVLSPVLPTPRQMMKMRTTKKTTKRRKGRLSCISTCARSNAIRRTTDYKREPTLFVNEKTAKGRNVKIRFLSVLSLIILLFTFFDARNIIIIIPTFRPMRRYRAHPSEILL